MPSKFFDILPDPTNLIATTGFTGTVAGKGFKAVNLSRTNTGDKDRAISGRLINRTNQQFKWLVSINYSPMPKASFIPIYSFLLEKRGTLKPFYVELPQYSFPKNPLFATFVQNSGTNIVTRAVVYKAGVVAIEITEAAWSGNSYTTTSLPTFGDVFTITDSNDSLHTKAYMVTHVETFNDYQSGNQPSTGHIRIHFTPGLQKYTYASATVNFNSPLIQVTQVEDIQEYELDADNLYSISLKLKEAFY